ncbi:MAG TPA: endo-1,4-beta-xylanase [Verrucomicrobiae bacterium]|nr:endo-1,4-beta-xylanase [Verrucomicrobiae bacterium]
MKLPLVLLSFATLLLANPSVCLPGEAASSTSPSLKEAFKDCFLIGAALNESQFTGRDARAAALIKKQFDSITPENVLKWGLVHPQPDTYDFGPADRYVEFGQSNGMFIIGHTLIWHSQTPHWVFHNADGSLLTRDALVTRMREHITTVVGRYRGRVKGWDVVNEALDEDGTMRSNYWMRIIGPDYVQKAFEFAHAADPAAQLYYNDYSLENEPKREGALRLIKALKAAGVHITGIGVQSHDKMDWPTAQQLDATIDSFANEGLKVMITELDVDVLPAAFRGPSAETSLNAKLTKDLNPYTNGLPESVQQALAKRYAELFSTFLKHRHQIARVTFWGVTDGNSWLNNWPVRGRTSYPLLFDREGHPKPAFDAVIGLATRAHLE